MKPTDSHRAKTSEDHFDRLARLLELEAQAEAARAMERARRLSPAEAEATGNSLVDLVIADEAAGLGGRFILRLVKRKSVPLPWHRLSVGTPVLLSATDGQPGPGRRGIVCDRSERSVEVAFDSLPADADDAETWRLDLYFDEISRLRQRAALQQAQSAAGNRLAQLRKVLLGEHDPEVGRRIEPVPLNASLNQSQREAVEFALSARDLALIHGPPGTGKTTAVVELIRQAVRRGEKVLACAPSNLGVDNMLERLAAAGERVVRLGHPARVLPELRARTLDLMVESHPDVRLARKLVREALQVRKKAARYTRAKPEKGAKRDLRAEAKALLADARRLEKAALNGILDGADILCATTTGLDYDLIGDRVFDLVVIDEACQSTEPGSWLPLLRAGRVVLAGDHCQLPPTIISHEAAEQGLDVSLFERMIHLLGPQIARRLIVQYRMHSIIMGFSSSEFYDNELRADPLVAEHLLCDLPGIERGRLTETAAEFIDTAGAQYDEELEPDGESRLNRQEAELVVRRVRELIATGVAPQQIAVIAPYAAQVRHLRAALHDISDLEVDSVDGFQGREKEVVVISLVRSNATGEIGFLADIRRTNVALTRARRKLIVIGDSATLASHPFYSRMVTYFEERGAYRTVWEES